MYTKLLKYWKHCSIITYYVHINNNFTMFIWCYLLLHIGFVHVNIYSNKTSYSWILKKLENYVLIHYKKKLGRTLLKNVHFMTILQNYVNVLISLDMNLSTSQKNERLVWWNKWWTFFQCNNKHFVLAKTIAFTKIILKRLKF